MNSPITRNFQTVAVHGIDEARDPFGAAADPIYMTSTYVFDSAEDAALTMSGEGAPFIYGRQHNPTQAVLERRIAALEGAEAALVTASGVSAISTSLLSILSSGDEVVVHDSMYSNAMLFFGQVLPRMGVQVKMIDMREASNLAAAVSSRTKLVYFESVVNPTCEVLSIQRLSRIARSVGALVMIDSTFVSPAIQQPLKHGADLVVQSMTKYINGNGDMIGGVVAGPARLLDTMRETGMKYIVGATLSPLNCFLALRGLKTLSLRMNEHSRSAHRVASMLSRHAQVAEVRYPFLESDPGYSIAVEQMSAGGGMLAFRLASGFEGATRLIRRLKLIKCGVSFGDAGSLIIHPGSLVRGRQKVEPRARLGPSVSMDLIRLSVGLEDCDDLVADLMQAIEL